LPQKRTPDTASNPTIGAYLAQIALTHSPTADAHQNGRALRAVPTLQAQRKALQFHDLVRHFQVFAQQGRATVGCRKKSSGLSQIQHRSRARKSATTTHTIDCSADFAAAR